MRRVLIGFLTVPAMLALSPAQAAPTQAEVNRARTECHALKMKVQKLEADRAGDPAVSDERERWERACARANMLMDARAGRSAPEPASQPEFAPMEEVAPPMRRERPVIEEPEDVPDEMDISLATALAVGRPRR